MPPELPEPFEQVFEIFQSPETLKTFNFWEPVKIEPVEEIAEPFVLEEIIVEREIVFAGPESAWSEPECTFRPPELEVEPSVVITKEEIPAALRKVVATRWQSESETF